MRLILFITSCVLIIGSLLWFVTTYAPVHCRQKYDVTYEAYYDGRAVLCVDSEGTLKAF